MDDVAFVPPYENASAPEFRLRALPHQRSSGIDARVRVAEISEEGWHPLG